MKKQKITNDTGQIRGKKNNMKTIGLLAYGETAPHALKGLVKDFSVLWIVTPPQIENILLPVEKLANEYKIPIHRANANKQIHELVIKTSPDAVVISSYNKILEQVLLNTSKFINVHHGDLPRFRGRANSNWAIIIGRTEIGLTFHEVTADLDAGHIYAQYMVPIEKKDTVKTVYDKFNKIIGEDLGTIVTKVLDGYKGEEQKGDPTYCCTRLPEDGYIDWNRTSKQVYNFIRALTKPFPGAFTYYEGKKMIIWESEIPENPKIFEGRIPGRIAGISKDGVEVLTGDGIIRIKNVFYKGKESNSSEIIRTVKRSLGINFVELYEKIMKEKNED